MDEKIVESNQSEVIKKGDLISDDLAMQLAMDVAIAGAPFVSPNPLVGCVIVDDCHRFLASGYHHRYGEAHAEIDAMAKLTDGELKNATLYVTLEPCAHHGKTGSCAKKIATLPLKKVVYGLTDPNPLVSGQGAAIIAAANISIHEYMGPLKNDLKDLCEVFLKNFTQQKVFVAAKVASSLDGQIALKTGESKWITSEVSREYVHELRSYYDALLIGRNTVETDDPSLNIRHPKIKKANKIIILDPQRRLLTKIMNGQTYKFLEKNRTHDIYFAVQNKIERAPYQQIEFSNLQDLLNQVWNLNFRSLFIEGGAKTYSSFLNAELIDRIYVFIAPIILGAKSGISWTGDVGVERMDQQVKLANPKIKKFASDTLISGTLTPRLKS